MDPDAPGPTPDRPVQDRAVREAGDGGTDIGGRDAAAAALLAVVVALAFHALLHPRVADADAFYHLGHAQEYLRTSLFDTAFPWTAFGAIGDVGADLWWGFHVLLLPFAAAFDDPAMAIRVAAGTLTVAALGAVGWLALRHGFLGAVLWPALFFMAVPNVLFRYLAVRPEVLSIPLVLLLLSALVRRRPWQVLGLSAAVTWIHLSMFWLGPGMVVVWALSTLGDRLFLEAHDTETDGRDPGAARTDAVPRGPLASIPGLLALVLGGTALGWLLRPNPLGAAELAWIQIAELLLEKTGDTPLTFAVDLAPLPPGVLFSTAWPLLLAWLGGLAYLALTAVEEREALRRIPARARVFLWSSTVMAAGFLFLTVAVARRSQVHWAAFAVVGVALMATWLTPVKQRGGMKRALLLAVPLLFAWSLWRNALNVQHVALPPDHMAEVAEWLEAESEPGELVFNTHWDTFGPLFARNRTNRYLGGMDPIFQYARDPRAYWSFHHLSTDVATTVTCPFPDCEPEQVVDTWEAMRTDFGARWVLVEPRRNPRLSLFLLEDPRFRLALETPREAVFEVLPPGETAPRPDFLGPPEGPAEGPSGGTAGEAPGDTLGPGGPDPGGGAGPGSGS